ncbi:hypothetical protein [Kitasatospora sp. NPDC088134]|uniref:hypothetical protein n=1 Tax=Kitasatospora sp. NPDC088134 TaxID=3364071 RepID=UPI003820DB6A
MPAHPTAGHYGPGPHGLLAFLAAHDRGDGIRFDQLPDGRWHAGDGEEGFTADSTDFRRLAAAHLADVGDFNDSPVRITPAGRNHVQAGLTPRSAAPNGSP